MELQTKTKHSNVKGHKMRDILWYPKTNKHSGSRTWRFNTAHTKACHCTWSSATSHLPP